jgi:mercuric ion binding protein
VLGTLAGPLSLATATPVQAAAAQATATFAIANMTCPTCPITVKTAMSHVSGVNSVSIDFKAKTATVVFDPARASVARIAAASTDAGYPARLAH